jgi:hypothetical protein
MKNVLLSPKSAADIDGFVDKILRGLGRPDPPLNLDDIRELLRLDRRYYTSSQDGVVREKISRLMIAGKQAFARPTLIWEAIRKLNLKALYLPDRKRILLDQSRPTVKQRWDEAHELGHSIIPWHNEMMLGDDEQTLTVVCHQTMEAEANFAAGQLLFMREQFLNEARDEVPSLALIRKLKPRFGNTLTTTLWRFVELAHRDLPIVGIVSGHPHRSKRLDSFNAADPCKYTIQSPAFAHRFSQISEPALFAHITSYCGSQRGGPLGVRQIVLNDDAGTPHDFRFETFFNQHDALTLGVYQRPRPVMVAVPPSPFDF